MNYITQTFEMKSERRVNIFKHFSGWLLYFLLTVTVTYLRGSIIPLWTVILNFMVFIAHFYYLAYYIVPRICQSNNYFLPGIHFILSLILFFGANYIISYITDIQAKEHSHILSPFPYKIFIVTYSLYFIQYSAFAIVFSMKNRTINNKKLQYEHERKQRELQEKIFALEKIDFERKQAAVEKKKTELKYALLKARVNPHFLYNTLHNFNAWAAETNEPLAEALAKFGALMRYACTPTEPDGKAILMEEDEQIQRIIFLLQMRFDNKLNIIYEVKGELIGIKIIPALFATLAENALKHGELRDPENPVKITLEVMKPVLTFKTANKKRIGPKEIGDGIGTPTIRELLHMEYPQRHNLIIEDTEEYYTCVLTIQL
jgi:two-component system, LytTR family, sensor kinase